MTDPVLPDTTSDENPVGWGDEAASDDDLDDEQRLAAERPPHYDKD
jgi:hypothetical protein